MVASGLCENALPHRGKTIQQVNSALTIRNAIIWFYIVEYEQHREGRAQYGSRLFERTGLSTNKKAVLENYVFRRLSEQYRLDQIKYWRTADGNEVDFVIEENVYAGKAIEVKLSRAEFRARKYTRFAETYPDYPLEVWSWMERVLL
ncbi:MAG: DUF4143 domain-containing protein [Saprospiraceae bacterium]|nr:DUF4143 domain-containing protein [Saprospiraceae bacterium]